MKWIRGISINIKMGLLLGILFLICTLSSTFAYWKYMDNRFEEEVHKISRSTISSIDDGIKSQFEYIYKYAMNICLDSEFQKLIQDDLKGKRLGSEQAIERILYKLMNLGSQIEAAGFISNQGKAYAVQSSGESVGEGISKEEIEHILEEKSSVRSWAITCENPLGESSGSVSMYYHLNDMESLERMGIFFIQIDMRQLIDSFYGTMRQYDLDFCIYDTEIKPEKLILPFSDSEMADVDDIIYEEDGRRYHWIYVSKAGNDFYMPGLTGVRGITVGLIVFHSFILLTGILLIMSSLIGPLKKMTRLLEKEGNGELFEIELGSDTKEIVRLQQAHNQMVRKIDDLVKEIISEQNEIRRLELQVLQEQINPHFLYNTLNSISALVMLKREGDAYKMVQALSDFYRRTLSRGRDIVTLEEELVISDDYLLIQGMRFENIFSVEKEIDPAVLRLRIPKLTLQPLIENAINHGLRSCGGILTIMAVRKNAYTLISIKDNGIGMTESKRKSLMEDNEERGDVSGFGLRKTIERLELFFGNYVTTEIRTAPGQGTEIEIRILDNAENGRDRLFLSGKKNEKRDIEDNAS